MARQGKLGILPHGETFFQIGLPCGGRVYPFGYGLKGCVSGPQQEMAGSPDVGPLLFPKFTAKIRRKKMVEFIELMNWEVFARPMVYSRAQLSRTAPLQ